MKRISLSTIILTAALALKCQESITLEAAFQLALSNNFHIQIQQNLAEIAVNNSNIGNAGLLPSVNANAGASLNITNTNLEFAGGLPSVNRDNAQSSNINAGITGNYVVFKGMSAQRQFQKLKINAAAIDAQSRASIESTLLQVANAYYVLSRAIEQDRIAKDNVAISIIRYQRAKIASEFGTALKTELLTARVDLTTDSATLLSAQLQRQNALRNLSKLLNTELSVETLTGTLSFELKDWTLDELMQNARSNNAILKNVELQNEMAKKDYQIAMSSAFPTLTANAGYSYNKQSTQAGIVLSNTGLGWNGSVALSYPIFNGFRTHTAIQNQKVTMEIRELERQNQEMQLATDLQNAWASYQQSIQLTDFEKKNMEASDLNLLRSKELFQSGQITNAQFREAQLSKANAEVRISNALISVKLNELELMRLSGQILSH